MIGASVQYLGEIACLLLLASGLPVDGFHIDVGDRLSVLDLLRVQQHDIGGGSFTLAEVNNVALLHAAPVQVLKAVAASVHLNCALVDTLVGLEFGLADEHSLYDLDEYNKRELRSVHCDGVGRRISDQTSANQGHDESEGGGAEDSMHNRKQNTKIECVLLRVDVVLGQLEVGLDLALRDVHLWPVFHALLFFHRIYLK